MPTSCAAPRATGWSAFSVTVSAVVIVGASKSPPRLGWAADVPSKRRRRLLRPRDANGLGPDQSERVFHFEKDRGALSRFDVHFERGIAREVFLLRLFVSIRVPAGGVSDALCGRE